MPERETQTAGPALPCPSLRISVTARCRLRCLYCMPPGGPGPSSRNAVLTFEDIRRFVRLVHSTLGRGKVRLTGGEPLLRADLPRLVGMLAEGGVPDLALTTNGQLLAALAGPLREAGLDRVNVSLDSLDAKRFHRLSGGSLPKTLAGIEAARRHGLTPVKINTVVLGGKNEEEVTRLARFALERDCHIRFLELMPIGRVALRAGALFVPTCRVKARLEEVFELRPLPRRPGRTSRDWLASDGRGLTGRIGFISPRTAPFCGGCRRLRLTSTGDLITCLAKGEGPNIRPALRGARPARLLRRMLRRAMRSKTRRAGFETVRTMRGVGG